MTHDLRAALEKIVNDYQVNHTSKWCLATAQTALAAHPGAQGEAEDTVARVAAAIMRARHHSCCEGRDFLRDFPLSDQDRAEARAAIAALSAAQQPVQAQERENFALAADPFPVDAITGEPKPWATPITQAPSGSEVGSDRDETARGRVTWHSSGEDEGPDVGLSLGLGEGRSLWIGELANATLAEAGVDPKAHDASWWIAMFDGDAVKVAGAVADQEAARDLFDAVTGRVAPAPSEPVRSDDRELIAELRELIQAGGFSADCLFSRAADALEGRGEGWNNPAATFAQDTPEIAQAIGVVMDLAPAEWDQRPLSLIHEIRRLLMPLTDEGSSMDTGGGDASADLWMTVQGCEYLVQIKPSLPAPPVQGEGE